MKEVISHRFGGFGVVAAGAMVVFLLGGCATTAPPPTEQMAEARSAVRQAEDVGAGEYAAVEYRRAQKKLDDAQAALSRGKHDRARRLAEQSAVDAELAGVKARSAKTQNAVRELQESIRVLREEISRPRN